VGPGGTASDPLVTSTFGSRYAFAALRCAVDNYNGDNVEWVGFPSGTTNVFCYYYAVDQAPAPGTIVVQKQLAAGETGSDTFQFTGTVSYNPGGDFEVPANGSVPFVRDSGVDWNFRERVAPDPLADPAFNFTSVTCTSADGQSTFPGSTFPSVNPFVSVDLAPGDRVVCTYVITRNLTELGVLKQTTGGTGGPFGFTVTPPGSSAIALADVTTTAADVPVEAGTIPDATAGTYQITETLPPATAAGSWAVAAFDCNGNPGPVSNHSVGHRPHPDRSGRYPARVHVHQPLRSEREPDHHEDHHRSGGHDQLRGHASQPHLGLRHAGGLDRGRPQRHDFLTGVPDGGLPGERQPTQPPRPRSVRHRRAGP
jgi:hypothetical protein